MKKKGSKKKVNSSKRRKKFFFFNSKVAPAVLVFVFLVLAILLGFVNTGNVVNTTITGQVGFLDSPASIKLPDAMSWLDLGSTWRDIIVYIIVLVMIFVMILDMLLLTSIFSNWVCFIIALGISIIGSLTNLIRQVSIWLITITAGLGALGGFVEIIIAIVVFVGLAFGSSKIAMFAAKRRAQRESIKAIKKSGEVSAAITGLKNIWGTLKK